MFLGPAIDISIHSNDFIDDGPTVAQAFQNSSVMDSLLSPLRSESARHDAGSRLTALVLAFAIAITMSLAAYVYAGTPYATMALATWALAFGGWMATTFRRRGSQRIEFSLYVGTAVALMVLYSEEWYRRFPSTLMKFFPGAFPPGVGITDDAFVGVFPLAGSALIVMGALAYYRRTAFGEFAAWTVFAWGCVAALSVYFVGPAAGHPGEYVGGMLTAPIPLTVALAGIYRTVRPGRDDVRDDVHATAMVGS